MWIELSVDWIVPGCNGAQRASRAVSRAYASRAAPAFGSSISASASRCRPAARLPVSSSSRPRFVYVEGSRGSASSDARKASRAASRRPAVASAAPSRLCPRAWPGLAFDEHPGLGDRLIGAAVEKEQRRRVVARGVGRWRDSAQPRDDGQQPLLVPDVGEHRRQLFQGADVGGVPLGGREGHSGRLLHGAGRGQEPGQGHLGLDPVWTARPGPGAGRPSPAPGWRRRRHGPAPRGRGDPRGRAAGRPRSRTRPPGGRWPRAASIPGCATAGLRRPPGRRRPPATGSSAASARSAAALSAPAREKTVRGPENSTRA